MQKKNLLTILALLTVACAAFGLTACNSGKEPTNDEKAGEFYTMQEAYDNGYLTQENLTSIAYYHNGGKPYGESINEDVSKSIKIAWAKKLAEDETDPQKDVTEDAVVIEKYYGAYNGCYVVIVDRIDAQYTEGYIPYTLEIGNVTFNCSYPKPQPIVWKVL